MIGAALADVRRRVPDATRAALSVAIAVLVGAAGFAAFVSLVGKNPFGAFAAMWRSTIIDSVGLGEVLIAATPIVLCALAVAVPARAGLWNLGGQGQLVFGVLGAAGASFAIPDGLVAPIALPILVLAGAVAGAAWAGISAVLRIAFRLNEAISSLLLSYVAVRVLDYAVHGPWKDAKSLGFPQARALPESHRLPIMGNGRLHMGILIALVMVVGVALLLSRTRWGFHLRVVGGNGEAARRAGLPVRGLITSSMLVGGALTGLAGAIQLAGVEFNARPEIAALYGFLGFLVSWLARHRPVAIAFAGLGIGAIVVGGDALQISADLPAASVNILMALILLAVLGRSRRVRGAEG